MPTGKTKDAGWQIGVSKTVDHPLDEVWDMVAGPGGLAIWLGTGVELDGEAGQAYEADDGTVGEVRSFRPHDRIRLTWQPPDWEHDSTVQLALTGTGDKTTIRLHQERLADGEERERQRTHWKRVADELARALAGG